MTNPFDALIFILLIAGALREMGFYLFSELLNCVSFLHSGIVIFACSYLSARETYVPLTAWLTCVPDCEDNRLSGLLRCT